MDMWAMMWMMKGWMSGGNMPQSSTQYEQPNRNFDPNKKKFSKGKAFASASKKFKKFKKFKKY